MFEAEFGELIRGPLPEAVRASENAQDNVSLEIDEQTKKNIEKIEENSRVAVQISGSLMVR